MDSKENPNYTPLMAISIAILLLAGGISLLLWDDDESTSGIQYSPTVERPEPDPETWQEDEIAQGQAIAYMVIVEAPSSEEELTLIALLSTIVVPRDMGFQPFFILEEGALDDHALWTINHHMDRDAPKFLFTNSDASEETVTGQVGEVWRVGFTVKAVNEFLRTMKGYEGIISVGSFEEALWVAPLARVLNQTMILHKPTFESQEDVWEAMSENDQPASYVLTVNPKDCMDMGGVDATNGNEVSYHVPWLSAVGGQIAAYHNAYVITNVTTPDNSDPIWDEWAYVLPEDNDDTPNFDDSHLNDYAVGLLAQLRQLDARYGPIENIALLGSAEAVPQWEIIDHSDSEPDYVSSDIIYGFIDNDHTAMDVPVGRFINYNVQGMANQITRTFDYERITPEVTVSYSDGDETYPWRTTGADLNGFEVADMRLQNTPGLWAVRDYEDEQFTDIHYVSTWGIGGSLGEEIMPQDLPTDEDIEAYVQSAGHVLYRGHGSWHGGFYTWRYYGQGVAGQGHIEGTDARHLYLPPQSTHIFSCENTKIHGLSYGGDPIEMDRAFATNWMYAGAVALVGATEVSYSNIGQDGGGVVGEVTGEHHWDLNNLWFAGLADKTLDDELTLGQAVMNTENRYMTYHNYDYTPVKGGDAHWKEIVMFSLLGDPAFKYYVTVPGEKDYNPWH